MTKEPRWTIADSRTDQPVVMCVYLTREQAENQIAGFRARDAKGKRPDVSHIMPHLVARQKRPDDR